MNAPYFIEPMLKQLRSDNIDTATRRQLLSRIAMNIGNKEALRHALGLDPEEFSSFYADMLKPTPTTMETIDSFIDRYAPAQKEEMPDTLQFAPVYNIAIEDDTPLSPATSPAEALAAINNPRHSTPSPTEVSTSSGKADVSKGASKSQSSNPQASQSLSESLAQIMIKNHNYAKALEIITELSLKNPEKSIYFADQIRFLRKVIYAGNLHK